MQTNDSKVPTIRAEGSRGTKDASQQRRWKPLLFKSRTHLFILRLKYWFVWCYRNAHREEVFCEDLAKKGENSLQCPFVTTGLCSPHHPMDTYWDGQGPSPTLKTMQSKSYS